MADPEDDLDALVRRVDPDRWLSSRFIADPQARADVVAIYAYDHELARAPRVASNSLLGEIRLTWWREALDEIYEDRAVRMHPTAQALAAAVRGRDLARGPLEAMIDARYRELDATPMTAEEALAWARDTGGAAAQAAAAILDADQDGAGAVEAGAAWRLARRAAADPMTAEPYAAAARGSLAAARKAVRGLSVGAFPAVAHAALAGGLAKGRAPAEWGARLRLIWAVARGRI